MYRSAEMQAGTSIFRLSARTTHVAHGIGHPSAHDGLHHPAGILKLFQEAVDFLERGTAAVSDTFTAATVDYLRLLPFQRGHGHYDCLDSLEGIVIYIHILKSLSHTRNHGSEVLYVPHLLYLLYLVIEIHESELVLGQLLLELPGLLLIKLLLGLLDKGYDIAHAENTVRNPLRMEDIKRLHLLS